MVKIKIADCTDIDSITALRVEQQIEAWNKKAENKDFSKYADSFAIMTKSRRVKIRRLIHKITCLLTCLFSYLFSCVFLNA